MPYLLDYARRASLASGELKPEDGADLNFLICHMTEEFIQSHGLSYHTLDEIDGALDLAHHEFKTRIVNPYEAIKRRGNGDVWPRTAEQIRQLEAAQDMANALGPTPE